MKIRHDYRAIRDRFADRFPEVKGIDDEEYLYNFFWDRYLDGTLEAKEIWPNDEVRTLISLCSGYESQGLSFKYCDMPFEILAWSEFDPESKAPLDKQPAVMAHNLLFPRWNDRNLGDMTKIDWDAWKRDNGYISCDLLTYSTPCFVAGTLIHTSKGLCPIEDIHAGMEVLTHTNTFKRVVIPMRKMFHGQMYTIKPMCSDQITCTPEHPFYVRKRYRYGHLGLRAFKPAEWVCAKDLTKDYYVGIAINNESRIPSWEGSIDNRWGHSNPVNELSEKLVNPDFWYLMGRYIGDGWRRYDDINKCIIICCSDRNQESLKSCLDRIGFGYTATRERTVIKVRIGGRELSEFVERYGYMAGGKHIDADTLMLPKYLLKSFLDGYVDSDGCFDGKYHKITTISRELAYGIVQCVGKVYHRPAKVYFCKRPETTVIEGRTVNQHDTYQVCWKESVDKQDKAFFEYGYVWCPINSIAVDHEECEVYNMEVEDDNSYTANGVIVHNCQSISSAGLQHGISKDSGTRSSILWFTENAIASLTPKYLLQENVSALVQKKFMNDFRLWRELVESYGYKNYLPPQFVTPDGEKTKEFCMNAKNYGCPQNRERVFLLSVRNDLGRKTFSFPAPVRLELRLKDILLKDVPEKYYLKQSTVDSFVEKNRENIEKGNNFAFKPKDCTDDGDDCSRE